MSGATATVGEFLAHPHVGYLLTPDIAAPSHIKLARRAHSWAADNSAFAKFDPVRFCGFLALVARVPGCLWATAPDVVGDCRSTLARFDVWQPVMRECGLAVAYVAQNGAEDDDLPWGRMSCLFIGGTTAWKLSHAALDLMTEAKRRGRWVHVGRVNSKKRIRWCVEAGADSLDGSGFGMFPAINIPKGLGWIVEARGEAGHAASDGQRRSA